MTCRPAVVARPGLLSLAVAAACAAPAVLAASSEDELREVVVSARSLEVSTPLELSRYGYDVEFVTAGTIRDHGFVDLPQALEMLVPGAHVATQFGAFSYTSLALQGSRNGDVLWTVDGVRVNNRLYNTTSPADTLPAGMVERIEVMKGGHGLLYGTQAAAGVINVVTRAFSDTPDGAVTLGGDSRDGLHLGAHGRGALGRHRFVAWVSKDESDGYRPYDDLQPGATTRDRAYDVQSLGLKYGFEFTPSLRLTLQGVHTEADLDYPTIFATDQNRRNEENLSGRLDYSPSAGLDLFLKAYLHDWDSDYVEDVENPVPFYWGFRDVGVSGAARIAAGRALDLYTGYEFQQYEGRDDYLLIEDRSEKVHAVYAQLRTTEGFSANTRLTAGLRYSDTGGTSATVWSASAVRELGRGLFIEGSLGTSFLLPDAYQLYAIDPTDTRGNPDLEPEESFNINLAVGGRFELAGGRPWSWQVSGWRRKVDNLIISDNTAPPAGFDEVFINVDESVKVSGYELLLRGGLAPGLSFDASFLYSRELGADDRQLQNRPRRSAKLGLGYAPAGRPFGVDVALKYTGTQSTNVTGFTRQVYGDDVIANLGAHWFVDGASRHHRLGLRVENVFDKGYETRIRSAVRSGTSTRFLYRNLGAPRTVFANYTYSF